MAHFRMAWFLPMTCRWRQNTGSSVIIGVIVGIALSLVIFPVVDEECLRSSDDHFSGGRSLQSDAGVVQTVEPNVEDYEPRLQLDGPKAKVPQFPRDPKRVVRPRFFSTELSIKEKLFVAIISTSGTVSALALSMNETLFHSVDMQVIFVPADASSLSKATASHKSVVEIGTKVSAAQFPLEVVRYVGDHYAKDYDFFFLTEDSTYVRGMKLMHLVTHISISQSVYMGESMGGGSFCSLRSGVLLSNSVLRATHENVHSCLDQQQPSVSPSATEVLGKCVVLRTGLSCQQQVQGHHFRTFALERGLSVESGLRSLQHDNRFNSALTVYPVARSEQHYMLHLHFTVIEMEEARRDVAALREDIATTDARLDEDQRVTAWPVGTDPSFRSKERFSVIRWDYVSETTIYPDDDFNSKRNLTEEETRDTAEVVNMSIALVQKNDHSLSFERPLNIYRRFDPTRGMEYIVDLVFRVTGSSRITKRLEAVRPLGKVELIPVPYVTENTRLVMVLPVSLLDHDATLQFLKDFTQVCLEKQDNSILMLVLSYERTGHGWAVDGDDDVHAPLKKAVNTLNSKYQTEGAKLSWISVKATSSPLSEFGMLDLISKRFQGNTLFLVCQSGMQIRVDYLNRARMNTVEGWQVFFPIPFVQFHPDVVFRDEMPPSTLEIHKRHGQFSSHTFDHYSFYNSDYLAGRKMVEHEVPLVRNDKDLGDRRHNAKSSYDVYSMFLAAKSVHVMRAVEPSLRVHFQMRLCEPDMSSDAYQQCLTRRSEGLASRSELAALILDYEQKDVSHVVDGHQKL